MTNATQPIDASDVVTPALHITQTVSEHKKLLIIPLIILMMAQFGTTIDNISLAFATKDIINNLNADISDLALANSVYAIITASFMISAGLLAIILKLRNALRIGIALAATGELVTAFSPNIEVFIWAGRALVGLSITLIIPSTLGLVAAIYEGKKRALAFGLVGSATGIAKVASIMGGFIIDILGFRIAFAILGIYFILLLCITLLLPNVSSDNKKLHFDFVGTIIFAMALFLLVVGMNKLSAWGVLQPVHPPFTLFGYSPALFSIISGMILLILLIFIENRIEDKYGVALLPKAFYKNPTVRNGLYACAMAFAGLWAIVIAIYPFFMLVANFSAGQTGLAALPTSITMIIFSVAVPRLFPDINRKLAIRTAYLLFAIGFLVISFGLKPHGVNILIYVGLGILGTGIGVLSSQANSVVTNAINKRDAEQSGGIQSTARNIGEACAISLLGMFLTFVQPVYYQYHVQKLPLEPASHALVSNAKFRFMSDSKFDALVAPLPVQQQITLKTTYVADRLRVAKGSMYFAALLSVLALFGTRHIPGQRQKT